MVWHSFSIACTYLPAYLVSYAVLTLASCCLSQLSEAQRRVQAAESEREGWERALRAASDRYFEQLQRREGEALSTTGALRAKVRELEEALAATSATHAAATTSAAAGVGLKAKTLGVTSLIDDAETLLAKSHAGASRRRATTRAASASAARHGTPPRKARTDGMVDDVDDGDSGTAVAGSTDGDGAGAVDARDVSQSMGQVLGTALLLASVRCLQRVVSKVVRNDGGTGEAATGSDVLAEVGPVVEELSALLVDCIQEQETARHAMQQAQGDLCDLRAANAALVKRLDAELVQREATTLQHIEKAGATDLEATGAARNTTVTIELLDRRVAELTTKLEAANDRAVEMSQRAHAAEGELRLTRDRLATLEARDAGMDAALASARAHGADDARDAMDAAVNAKAEELRTWMDGVVDTVFGATAEPDVDVDVPSPDDAGLAAGLGSTATVRAAVASMTQELTAGLAGATAAKASLMQRLDVALAHNRSLVEQVNALSQLHASPATPTHSGSETGAADGVQAAAAAARRRAQAPRGSALGSGGWDRGAGRAVPRTAAAQMEDGGSDGTGSDAGGRHAQSVAVQLARAVAERDASRSQLHECERQLSTARQACHKTEQELNKLLLWRQDQDSRQRVTRRSLQQELAGASASVSGCGVVLAGAGG